MNIPARDPRGPFDALNDHIISQNERFNKLVDPMRVLLSLPEDGHIIFGEESLAYSTESGWYTYTLRLRPQDDPRRPFFK